MASSRDSALTARLRPATSFRAHALPHLPLKTLSRQPFKSVRACAQSCCPVAHCAHAQPRLGFRGRGSLSNAGELDAGGASVGQVRRSRAHQCLATYQVVHRDCWPVVTLFARIHFTPHLCNGTTAYTWGFFYPIDVEECTRRPTSNIK